MYMFYIKKQGSGKLYSPYEEEQEIVTTDAYDHEVTTTIVDIWSTDDLSELGDKYKELLAYYTTEQIKIVQALEPTILVDIVD